MADEQAPATPGAETPGEVTIDIGGGNTFNKQQIIDLKTAKDGIESTHKTYKQDADGKLGELDKARTDYVEANRARIEATAARDAADAKVKELNLRLEGYVSPDTYGKMKESNDLLVLKGVSDKIDVASTKYGVAKDKFTGKSELEINAYIEGLENAAPAPRVPGTPGSMPTPQGGQQTTLHEENLKVIADARKSKKER